MTELKFRAWSEETKSFEHFDLYEGTECGLTNLQIWARNNPIEQYTGIKDKNGKEIYEGDIITDEDSCGKVWTSKVVYDEVYAEFACDAIGKPNWWSFEGANLDKLEVIGNIHENPELCREEEK